MKFLMPIKAQRVKYFFFYYIFYVIKENVLK